MRWTHVSITTDARFAEVALRIVNIRLLIALLAKLRFVVYPMNDDPTRRCEFNELVPNIVGRLSTTGHTVLAQIEVSTI